MALWESWPLCVKLWHVRPRHRQKVWFILSFWGAPPSAWDPINNYHLFLMLTEPCVCLFFVPCVVFECISVCVCNCLCATVATHQIGLCWHESARCVSGSIKLPQTKEYGNKAGDEWIISCITNFSLPIYSSPFLPPSGPCVTRDPTAVTARDPCPLSPLLGS